MPSGPLLAVALAPALAAASFDCSGYPYYKLNSVTRNNLGGAGPDSGDTGLIYSAVGENGAIDGQSFELHLNVSGGTFSPQNVNQIGLDGVYGSINLRSGTEVSLSVRKWTGAAYEPLDHFHLTFFNIDKGSNGAVESIQVSHWSNAYLGQRTDVNSERQDGGGIKFEGTQEGPGEWTDSDPLTLSSEQFNRAVSVTIGEVETLTLTLKVSSASPPEGRWFKFVGRPVLRCANEADGAAYRLSVLNGAPGGKPAARLALLAAALIGAARRLLP